MADRGALGGVIAGKFHALALDLAQDRVDELGARARLGQLDGLGDRGVGRDVGVEQLVEAEQQRRADLRLEPAIDVPGNDPVERRPPLNGAEDEPLGKGAVTGVEVAGVAVQCAVGVGALLLDAPQDGQRGAAGGAGWHRS